jgi:subtilase family serine protease
MSYWLALKEGEKMLKRKLLLVAGIITLLATLFISLGAAPSDAPREGRPEQPQPGQARSPLYFKQVAEPMRSHKVGIAAGATATAPYNPASIQGAYSFGAFATTGGSGEAIAIIDAYGDSRLASDISNFDSAFGLPAATLNISYPAGNPRGSSSGWAIETALDVEWAHANAPQATIYVVISPDATFTNLLKCVNYAATLKNVVAISMSWGAPENGSGMSSVISAYDAAFKTITGKGIILLAASGDAGAYDGTRSLTTDYPASSPYVIGVGGTTLKLSGAGVWGSETGWSGSGGGYSAVEKEPSPGISTPNGKRGVPDVSFDADPNTGIYVYCFPYWYEVGGTSVGAPNWAAIVADGAANTTAITLNLGYLYGIVYTSYYGSEIHDITGGNNGYYSAGNGWDAVTGIGTPIVSGLLTPSK